MIAAHEGRKLTAHARLLRDRTGRLRGAYGHHRIGVAVYQQHRRSSVLEAGLIDGPAGEADRSAHPRRVARVAAAPWILPADRHLERGERARGMAADEDAQASRRVGTSRARQGTRGAPSRDAPRADLLDSGRLGVLRPEGPLPVLVTDGVPGWTPLNRLGVQHRSSGRTPPGSRKNCHSTSDHLLSLVRRIEADNAAGRISPRVPHPRTR